ncbi:unnamed protein product [Tuber melanosporum]|uniref:(Perigord truffle) hypothetical protein n=1 Tax=Tuber melanosporum (strain Mel28) TaxID=656061 RepID=D5GGV1_TUBMM|nr:uncharacterized protein GSTUM_00007523001 [Tuber melanosporum]CAZ83723.1 unnamed protein product [Tuber melanosporum]
METNYALLRESLTPAILQKSILSPNPATDLEDLSDFLDYLTQELYTFLPPPLQTATPLSTTTLYHPLIPPLSTLPPSITESLTNYDIVPDTDDVEKLISRVLSEYIDAACTPPPEWTGAGSRNDACEICERVGVGITYHHLIPKSTHAKVIKRKWHPEVMLDSVAWLCRPCHSTVHRCASNEVLAREYYTVALLLEREDIQRGLKNR